MVHPAARRVPRTVGPGPCRRVWASDPRRRLRPRDRLYPAAGCPAAGRADRLRFGLRGCFAPRSRSGRRTRLNFASRAGQVKRRNQRVQRAGLTRRTGVCDRACPEHAMLAVAARVAVLDRPSLPDEKGIELRCVGGDGQYLEVADEDALEGPGVVVELISAGCYFARLR